MAKMTVHDEMMMHRGDLVVFFFDPPVNISFGFLIGRSIPSP